MNTVGEFINTLGQTENFQGRHWLRVDLRCTLGEEALYNFMAAPLVREVVLELAEWLQIFIQQELDHINEQKLYLDTIKAGHAFLQEVYHLAVQQGIPIKLGEVDTSLTPSEYLAAAGLVTISPEGTVKPVEPIVLFGNN